MKQRIITPLLFAIIFLSACKKEASTTVDPQSQIAPKSLVQSAVAVQGTAVTSLLKGFVKVQIAKDSSMADDIVISFDPAAKTYFVPDEDARTFEGFGAVSLSSLSSDNIPLAINAMPFPTNSYKIPLVANAKSDGIYKLSMTQVTNIPAIFQLWLMDSYKKDSLDIKNNHTYSFNLKAADTNSYGSHRFSLVIRQNKALGVHLLAFNAAKTTTGAQLNWTTENEEDYTTFAVQRSSDKGQTFSSIYNVISSALGNYNFMDTTPPSGQYQYRLMVKDLNGTINYTNPVSINY